MKQIMEENGRVVLYNATPSDVDYLMLMESSFTSSSTSTDSSTASDARSAAPDIEQLFRDICNEYSRCAHEAGRVLPTEWTMPDLVRMMVGDEALQRDFLTDAYFDVMFCGIRSWGCEELLNLLDLINYNI
uniref:hypothetical protein n=1 Tax=Bidens bipinnata TaxID=1527831 RepID=UPI001EE082C3|nr:hypothetical protein MFQ52_mgp39 [Bidens bipinnata]YP_010352567.1 hypothetical protein MFQ53_mgp59 [Bidens parviflora]YP_010352705.1 hypothetical protein MFU86_mgp39 [Bidens biternata]YP_010352783.1 hypothetical protein MZG22_mgp20 [Bidens pilosa]UIR99382.1 hypothetical protein [Bidens alba var. radiata]UIR98922.1 hypothetical protein [Bidens parviflora]UIR99060.1 hypothetical protein [Bidens bipinnata]UIR99122.1 hypothetical protein [Bidens biternata]UIR99184.1 hypothetical protein [Bid